MGHPRLSKFVVWGPKAQKLWVGVFKGIGGRGVEVFSMETQFFQTSVISSSFKAVDSMEAYTNFAVTKVAGKVLLGHPGLSTIGALSCPQLERGGNYTAGYAL